MVVLERKRRMGGERVEKDDHLAQAWLQESMILYYLCKQFLCQQSESVQMCPEKAVVLSGGPGLNSFTLIVSGRKTLFSICLPECKI